MLEVKAINSFYAKAHILEDLSFSVGAGEVVYARVDLAVDVLDEPGEWLDAFPGHPGRRVRVLRGLQITSPHGIGEHFHDGDQLADLGGRVVLVLDSGLLGQRVGGSGGLYRRCGLGGTVCAAVGRIAAGVPAGAGGEYQPCGHHRNWPRDVPCH